MSAFLVAYVFLSYFLLSGLLKTEILNDFLIRMIQLVKNAKTQKVDIFTPSRYKTLKITSILFSAKTQNEIFLPAMSDWDEEIFEALKENKDANLFMINVRNTYGFIMAMWQKSPLGDLLEYVRKIAS